MLFLFTLPWSCNYFHATRAGARVIQRGGALCAALFEGKLEHHESFGRRACSAP